MPIKPIEPTEPHADLLIVAKELLSSCGYQVELVFVCGHQDHGHPMTLSRDTWPNVEANLLAKQKASIPHMGPIYYKLPGNPWSCYAENQQIMKQFDMSLWMFINRKYAQTYWAKCKSLHPEQLKLVDWQSLKCTMKSVPLS